MFDEIYKKKIYWVHIMFLVLCVGNYNLKGIY